MGFQQPRFAWNLSFFIHACFIMFLGFATFCLSTQKLWNPGNALLGTCNRFKELSVENTSCDFIWPSAALFNQLFECCSPVHRFQLIRVVRVVQGKSCRATANKEGVWSIMYNLLLFWLGKPAASCYETCVSISLQAVCCPFNLLQSVSNTLATMICSGLVKIQFVWYLATEDFQTKKHEKQISWLVVLTILKNISQWEGLSHILWKIKNVWNHQSVGKRSFTHQSRRC